MGRWKPWQQKQKFTMKNIFNKLTLLKGKQEANQNSVSLSSNMSYDSHND